MRDITLLIAHPDDEALFCWPVLDRVKRIVCASSDLNNPARAFCRERRYCLEDVGKLLGAEIVCFDADSEFYRLPTRDGSLFRHIHALIDALATSETVFTHNSWGEYGNLDHILCHHAVRLWNSECRGELVVSDIATEINWLPVTPWFQSEEFFGEAYKDHFLDREMFDRIKAIYDARGCWTWAWAPVEKCRVYSL